MDKWKEFTNEGKALREEGSFDRAVALGADINRAEIDHLISKGWTTPALESFENKSVIKLITIGSHMCSASRNNMKLKG